MRVDFSELIKEGTEVKLFCNGSEGTISSIGFETSARKWYNVCLRNGETQPVGLDYLAPIEHPVHRLLEFWNNEGRERGCSFLIIGLDASGHWHAFYGKNESDYPVLVKTKKDLSFKYYWDLRYDNFA